MKTTPITFVSFCVDIDRGLLPMSNTIHRSFETYKRGINDSLITNVPLVLYTSIDDLRIPEHRNETNFRQYKLNKELIEKEFPNFELYQNSYHTTHRDEIADSLFYYTPLVVLKMKKMMEVIEDNPFNSDIFFWIDCFFARGMIDTNFLYYEDRKGNLKLPYPNLVGDFQLDNVFTAIASLRNITSLNITDEHIKKSITKTETACFILTSKGVLNFWKIFLEFLF